MSVCGQYSSSKKRLFERIHRALGKQHTCTIKKHRVSIVLSLLPSCPLKLRCCREPFISDEDEVTELGLAKVMVAQFRAGMWRRNGYSLLNQIYFYHNVRLRNETYDRDITLLQASLFWATTGQVLIVETPEAAAALLESNEFLIHVLNKYGLLAWASNTYDSTQDEANAQLTVTIAEEFLGLILTLVSERSLPGVGAVTETDRLQREVVQLLCVEPLPHSQLVKLLPRGSSPAREAQVEQVLQRVAHFRRDNRAAAVTSATSAADASASTR
ncbi:hypothetical protein HPB51_014070 [Rhipicephalus microplus]|uniref:E3 ubiquitin-protein ligase n=1 Tax=Rhipicephalus microplus TaxID=6941 RepID=A0A9J6EA75_RHIMP|nr:hypothetical protein HPB51_014070 [Rhipicephalus microplus]